MRRIFLGWRETARESVVDFLWRRYALGHDFSRLMAERGEDGAERRLEPTELAEGAEGEEGEVQPAALPENDRRERESSGPARLNGRGSALESPAFWDLSSVILVTASARAGRQLLETISLRAEQRGVGYFPPELTTVGQLPELLYECRRPFASPLVQQLVWAEALRAASAEELAHLLTEIPADDADSRWWELGMLLARQHRELAAEGWDFARVAAEVARAQGSGEAQRWHALARIQRRYLDRLDQLGRWDRQTARLFALDHAECRLEQDLVLVGTVDLNAALRRMLEQVRQRVTVLIYADSSWEDRFDELGCVVPERWQTAEIPLRERDLIQVDRPTDQARALVGCLADLGGRFAADQITIGVPEEPIVGVIQRELAAAGVRSRYGPGVSMEATRPIRLWRALINWLDRRTTATLADLLRHPDLMAAAKRRLGTSRAAAQERVAARVAFKSRSDRGAQSDSPALPQATEVVTAEVSWEAMIEAFDGYCHDRLPVTMDQLRDCLAGERRGGEAAKQWGLVERLLALLETLFAPVMGGPRQPHEWVQPWQRVLSELYGDRLFDLDDPRDKRVWGGCEAWREGLQALAEIPDSLSLPITAAQAGLLALHSCPNQQISAPPAGDSIELLGWLELVLDSAPVLLVTSFNEGLIPTSTGSDLFLPNSLRAHLGLDDNQRRYARDAYALAALTKSRSILRLLFTRHDDQGAMRLPSRLLFATGDEQRVTRCLRLFGEPSEVSPELSVEERSRQGEGRPGFPVPQPGGGVELPEINVTDFKLYLACPYRYYLSRVLRLGSQSPPPLELDGAAFGNRLHEVLESFGSSEYRNATDADQIADFLLAALYARMRAVYGSHPAPAIQLQTAQMAARLRVFAERQAEWRRAGWTIVMTEGEQRTVTRTWHWQGESIDLRGRIDRIDQHEITGEILILDYKSAEAGPSPRAAHHRRSSPAVVEDWIDLQLPLYRYLIDPSWSASRVDCGFVTLPKSPPDAGFQRAGWTSEELRLADEAAWRVIHAIRAGQFWPPRAPSPLFDGALDRICQEGVFGREWGLES